MGSEAILGHRTQLELLRRAVESGRVAHAYLFAGPGGVGKRLTAVNLAMALNCEAVVEGVACRKCLLCKAVESGRSPNLLVFGPDNGLIRVDAIRELQKSLTYRVEKGVRVAVLCEADLMNREASNAFLKTLEEPPPGSVIILISSRPDSFLPTILSRCQRINFRPLDDDVLEEILSERLDFASDKARLGARLGGGSVEAAVRAIDEQTLEKKHAVIGRLKDLGPGDVVEIMKLAEELAKDEEIEGTLEIIKSWYRDMLMCHEGCDELALCDATEELRTKAESFGFERLSASFYMVEAALSSIRPPANANRQLAMECLLMDLCIGPHKDSGQTGISGI